MKVSELTPNPKNPRKISKKKLEGLKASLEKFGDLSGFVFNRRTQRLVGGHQRQKVLESAEIVKEPRQSRSGTVAEGYVVIDGERFQYREVDWDEKTETEALIAANKHGGDWDHDLLKLNLAEFPDMDMQITGFELETDEEYLKNNPGLDSTLHKENISTAVTEPPKEFDPGEIRAVEQKHIFEVVVTCQDEAEQEAVYDKLKSDGLECRVLSM